MAQERVSTHTLVRAEDCINVNTARRSHNEKGQRMSSGNSHSSESPRVSGQSPGSTVGRSSAGQRDLERLEGSQENAGSTEERSALFLPDSDYSTSKKRSLDQIQSPSQGPGPKRLASHKPRRAPFGERKHEAKSQLPCAEHRDVEGQLPRKDIMSETISKEALPELLAKARDTIRQLEEDKARMVSELAAERARTVTLSNQAKLLARQVAAAEETVKSAQDTIGKLEVGLDAAHTEIARLKAERDSAFPAATDGLPLDCVRQQLRPVDEAADARFAVIAEKVAAMQSRIRAQAALLWEQTQLIDELSQQKDRQAEQFAVVNERISELTRIIEDF